MITEQQFLNAKKLIEDYKEQEKNKKQKKVRKNDLILQKNNDELKRMFEWYFKSPNFLRFSAMLKTIEQIYEYEFKTKLGRNNSIKILDCLIQKGVILKSGDFGFSEYSINKN